MLLWSIIHFNGDINWLMNRHKRFNQNMHMIFFCNKWSWALFAAWGISACGSVLNPKDASRFFKSTIKIKETQIPGECLWLTFPHPSLFPPPLSGPLLVKVYSSVQGQLFANLKITHNLLSTANKAAQLQWSSHLGKNLTKLLRRFTYKIQKHLESRQQVHRLNKVDEKELLKLQLFSRF